MLPVVGQVVLCTWVPGREAGAEIQPVFHLPTWAPMGWHLQRDIHTKAPELAATLERKSRDFWQMTNPTTFFVGRLGSHRLDPSPLGCPLSGLGLSTKGLLFWVTHYLSP